MKKALRRVKSVFHGWFGPPSSRAEKKGKQCRPLLEVLEDRCVPAVFTVNTLSDAITADDKLSLREAIQAANNNANASTDVDIINFKNGLKGTIFLEDGQLDINESLKIKGPGSGILAISGDGDGDENHDEPGNTRIFNIEGAEDTVNVTISGLKLTRGNARAEIPGPDPGVAQSNSGDAKGGAIRARLDFGGTLTVRSCVVSRNIAGDQGGAIAAVQGNHITVGSGASADLVIRDSVLSHNTSGTEGGVTGNEGGAVFFNTGGKFTFDNTTFKNNTAGQADGGAVSIEDGFGTISDCKFLQNTAAGDGGALHLENASTNLTSCTFSGNRANGNGAGLIGQGGGAIYQDGASVLLTDCTLNGNTATNDFIGLSAGFAGAKGQLTANGTARVINNKLRLTEGSFQEAGSAFTNTRLDVTAFSTTFTFKLSPGADTADGVMFVIHGQDPAALGNPGGFLGYGGITPSVGVKFDLINNNGEGPNSTGLFINGADPFNNGSTTSLTPSGIDLHSGHPMLVTIAYDGMTLSVQITDTITGQSAAQQYTVDIPDILSDGAGYVGFTGGTGAQTARQEILDWTFSHSQQVDGGGIYHADGELTLRNCTLSGNRAEDGDGGGISSGGGGEESSVTLTNCTVTRNRALRGGGISADAATVNILNTIVAGNFDAEGKNDLFREGGYEEEDRLQSGGTFNALFSLIQSSEDAVNGDNEYNIFGKAAKLGPLQDNGGSTQTHALQPDSPAIGKGSNELAKDAGLTTDQRGEPRIVNGRVDIGAFEFSISDFRFPRRWFRTR